MMKLESSAIFDVDRLHSAYIIEAHDAFDKLSYVRSLIKSIFCVEFLRDKSNPRFAEGSLSEEKIKKMVDDGTHLDVIHIQATVSSTSRTNKKSVKVEDIERFIADISSSPFQSNHRIGIIENADTMTVQSANSLLKTLEEPSEGVIIFLLSENSLTLPETVRSRCVTIRPLSGARTLKKEYPDLGQKMLRLIEKESFFFEYAALANELRTDREKAFGVVDALEEQIAAKMRNASAHEAQEYFKAIRECEECKRNLKANGKVDFAIKKMLWTLGGENEDSSWN